MLSAGWNAHKLNAPGKFLVSAPEHDIPRRARAYLVTDNAVRDTCERHARIPRQLDYISHAALGAKPLNILSDYTQVAVNSAAEHDPVPEDGRPDPDTILNNALSSAPAEGIPVSELITATGMSRRWVFYRLRQLAAEGRAVQTVRGHWRSLP